MASTGEAFGLFWDSENGDRTYSAASFEYWLKKFFTSGVFNGDLQVKATSGMTLEVEAGYTNADGKVKFWNAPFNVTLDAANSTYPRIDTVVIRRDNVNRQITCEKVTGAYSGDTPQPTAPTRNSEIFELVIAQIYVGAGVTGVTQSNITDTRPNNELCGYITGTVEELDFSAFTAQFEAYFAEFKRNQMADFQAWEVAQQAAYAAWFNLVQQQQIQDKADWDAWYAALQEELHELPEDTAEYLQIEIDEIRTSGTTGSILKISTTETSLEGKTVTVTNGTETRTATFDENLECLIAGYKGTGEVTISSSDGIQTATTVVTIPYFGNYTYNIAFWAATVNIQGDDNLKGATITVKDSDDLTVGTVVLNVITGRGVFNASKADTYTFNYSYQGTAYSESLVVDEQITYSLSLSAGFAWRRWVDTARFLDSTDYNSLDEVLADEEAVRELCLEHACVDYMAEVASTNEELETVINNDLFAKWVNNSDYALDFLGANAVIKALMDEADKYFYGEWALMPQVPTMTSNTAPYGEASAHTSDTNGEAYRAFDSNNTQAWVSTTSDSNAWLQYTFPSAKVITYLEMCPYITNRGNSVKQFKVLASNDNFVTSDELYVSEVFENSTTVTYDFTIKVHFNDTHVAYTSYRIAVLSTYDTSNYKGIRELQFYAWQPKGNVPVMTANNAPYGTVNASAQSSGFNAYYAFDNNDSTKFAVGTTGNVYVEYEFTNPICPKRISMKGIENSNRGNTYKFVASNDGSTWDEITDLSTEITAEQNFEKDVECNSYYKKLRVAWVGTTGTSGSAGLMFTSLQFYGRELSVSVPTMTGNTTPYGEASATLTYSSDHYAWHAFDNSDATFWGAGATTLPQTIYYEFTESIVLSAFSYSAYSYNNAAKDVAIVDANGNELETFTLQNTGDKQFIKLNGTYTGGKFGLKIKTTYNSVGASAKELQFYGFDYSEKEFEEGSTKKWLYDHGVELEALNETPFTNNTWGRGSVTKGSNEITVTTPAIANGCDGFRNDSAINLTNYNLVRVKIGNVQFSDANNDKIVIFIASNRDELSSEILGSASFGNSSKSTNLPDNLSLDVSSINANGYVYCSMINSNAKSVDFKELWLE